MIETPRLRLLPATVKSLQAELAGESDTLAAMLGVAPPAVWPPELYDADAMRFTLHQLETEPDSHRWSLHYFVHKDEMRLVGAGGYKGGPRNGAVELGYSVLEPDRRQGYAAEATRGLIARAFADPAVDRVIAHTLPELLASIGVLQKLGFALQAETEEEGAIMFALTRVSWRRQ